MCDQGQMLKFINLARQFPAYYINLIDKQLDSFLNDKEIPVNEDMIYQTNEGKQAWKEARLFLQKQITLPAFQYHEGLSMSAKDHVSDLATHNLFGHTGSDKSSFSDRILRHCKKEQGSMAEIIGADFNLQNRNNAEMTILALIIDDGVVDRGHRKTIFNPQYRFIGCKSAIQKDKIITVFNMTQNRLQIRGQSKMSNYELSQFSQRKNSTSSKLKVVKMEQKSGKFAKSQALDNERLKDKKSKENKSKKLFEQQSLNYQSKIETSGGPLKSLNSEFKNGKKISEMKENIRIYNENQAKVTEKHTFIYFEDGSQEQNIERHTVFS